MSFSFNINDVNSLQLSASELAKEMIDTFSRRLTDEEKTSIGNLISMIDLPSNDLERNDDTGNAILDFRGNLSFSNVSSITYQELNNFKDDIENDIATDPRELNSFDSDSSSTSIFELEIYQHSLKAFNSFINREELNEDKLNKLELVEILDLSPDGSGNIIIGNDEIEKYKEIVLLRGEGLDEENINRIIYDPESESGLIDKDTFEDWQAESEKAEVTRKHFGFENSNVSKFALRNLEHFIKMNRIDTLATNPDGTIDDTDPNLSNITDSINLYFDNDSDGQITVADLNNLLKQYNFEKEKSDNKFDLNGDGVISGDNELRLAAKDKIDSNGNGVISASEIQNLTRMQQSGFYSNFFDLNGDLKLDSNDIDIYESLQSSYSQSLKNSFLTSFSEISDLEKAKIVLGKLQVETRNIITEEQLKTTLKNLPFAKLELLKDLSLGTSHSNPNYNNFDINNDFVFDAEDFGYYQSVFDNIFKPIIELPDNVAKQNKAISLFDDDGDGLLDENEITLLNRMLKSDEINNFYDLGFEFATGDSIEDLELKFNKVGSVTNQLSANYDANDPATWQYSVDNDDFYNYLHVYKKMTAASRLISTLTDLSVGGTAGKNIALNFFQLKSSFDGREDLKEYTADSPPTGVPNNILDLSYTKLDGSTETIREFFDNNVSNLDVNGDGDISTDYYLYEELLEQWLEESEKLIALREELSEGD
ncbi:MAG: hypothetical protein HRT47_02570 [Candidatus Caenarcaniphilales bacterium]|nr:hypothetical protein [Candidatus Caenarcaniphilales bacterium]